MYLILLCYYTHILVESKLYTTICYDQYVFALFSVLSYALLFPPFLQHFLSMQQNNESNVFCYTGQRHFSGGCTAFDSRGRIAEGRQHPSFSKSQDNTVCSVDPIVTYGIESDSVQRLSVCYIASPNEYCNVTHGEEIQSWKSCLLWTSLMWSVLSVYLSVKWDAVSCTFCIILDVLV